MVRVAKEKNAAKYCASCTNSSPDSVGGSDGNYFHGLRDGKKTQDDENDRDDAGDESGEALTIF